MSAGAKVAVLIGAAVIGIGGGALIALSGSGDSETTTTTGSTTSAIQSTDTTTTSVAAVSSEPVEDEGGSGVECDPIGARRAGTTLTLVEQWENDNFVVQICADEGGDFWYHGRRVEGDPEVDSLTLPTTRAANGYRAVTEAGYAYVVASQSLIVTNTRDEVVVSEPLVLTGP